MPSVDSYLTNRFFTQNKGIMRFFKIFSGQKMTAKGEKSAAQNVSPSCLPLSQPDA